MLGPVFGKKSQTEDLKRYTQGCLKYVNMGLQAALLTSAALTTEVDMLKQNLARSENKLGHAKRQLEESEGKKYLIEICERCNCKKCQD